MKISMNKVFKDAYHAPERYRVLYGGAGSGKSHYVAQEALLNMLESKEYRYLAVRKTGRSLRNSVFKLMVDMILELNLGEFFKINVTEMSITCKNGSSLVTSGLDDVEKLKSIANINRIWIEEASEITETDFNQLDLRLRGQSKVGYQLTLTFNPISELHWLKKSFFDIGRPDTYILKTTYLDNHFLDDSYINTLNQLKHEDYNYYRIYALGEWGNIGNLVFSNWEKQDLTELKRSFDNIHHGLDFGFAEDPTAYVQVHLDSKRKIIYITEEFYKYEHFIDEIAEELKKKLRHREMVYCDTEPRSIADLKRNGINARSAKKGPGSIEHGIKFLQSHKIIIDSNCKNAIKEISSYKWRESKDGEVIPKPVDENNHIIDALRYALETEMTNSKLKVKTFKGGI